MDILRYVALRDAKRFMESTNELRNIDSMDSVIIIAVRIVIIKFDGPIAH